MTTLARFLTSDWILAFMAFGVMGILFCMENDCSFSSMTTKSPISSLSKDFLK